VRSPHDRHVGNIDVKECKSEVVLNEIEMFRGNALLSSKVTRGENTWGRAHGHIDAVTL
jgi:hypothetical protein